MSNVTMIEEHAGESTTSIKGLDSKGRRCELLDLARSYGAIKCAAVIAKDQVELSKRDVESAKAKLDAFYAEKAAPEEALLSRLDAAIKAYEGRRGNNEAALAAKVEVVTDQFDEFEKVTREQAAELHAEMGRAADALDMDNKIAKIYVSAVRTWAARVADCAFGMLDD